MPVASEDTQESLGSLSDICIHPDTGVVEGFFVRTPSIFGGEDLFLATADIRHWGTRIRVVNGDVLGAIEDRVRLTTLLSEGRMILGARMITKSGQRLGRCRDVQFETKTFRLEWLFPRTFFRWGIPVPLTSIVEVKREAIVVRDGFIEERPSVLTVIDELAEGGTPRVPEVS